MSLRTRVIAALAGATMLGGAITEVVQHNEGLSLTAYKDSAGIPTICYGETKGVKMGQRATLSDCQKQLIESAGEHAKALDGLPMQLSDVALIGSVDFIYNVGVAGFNGSAVKRHLKNLDYAAAGKAVLNWRYITLPNGTKYDCSKLVNGKPNRMCWGLWKRRQWQAKAIGNQYDSVESAVNALRKG